MSYLALKEDDEYFPRKSTVSKVPLRVNEIAESWLKQCGVFEVELLAELADANLHVQRAILAQAQEMRAMYEDPPPLAG